MPRAGMRLPRWGAKPWDGVRWIPCCVETAGQGHDQGLPINIARNR